jgi:hypothetical protein
MGRDRAALVTSVAVFCLLALAPRVFPADSRDSLAEARRLYNQGHFDAAIAATERVRGTPVRPDAPGTASVAEVADLVAARAYLERFRGTSEPDDLASARDRLRRLDPAGFDPGERTEFLIGLGETLYFDESYGAAADVFWSVLDSRDGQAGAPGVAPGRDRILDWWASATDRDARPKSEAERQAIYQMIRNRMREELAGEPRSAAASYWLAAAARAQGDLDAAWDSAEAGWTRAPLAADHGVALRADLDRLMLEGVVPDRATITSQPVDTLRAQWEDFKARWKN